MTELPETDKTGWQCRCGEEFIGTSSVPFDKIKEHVLNCEQAPEMVKEAFKEKQ